MTALFPSLVIRDETTCLVIRNEAICTIYQELSKELAACIHDYIAAMLTEATVCNYSLAKRSRQVHTVVVNKDEIRYLEMCHTFTQLLYHTKKSS